MKSSIVKHRRHRTYLPTAARLAAFAACLLVVVPACSKPGNSAAKFELNNQNADLDDFRDVGGDDEARQQEKKANRESRDYLATALQAMFGTPDRPFVFRESGLDLRKIRIASGPVGGLPKAVQDADLKQLTDDYAKLKQTQPEVEAAAKSKDAQLLTNLTTFAASKGIQNAKTPADLKENEAAFREQFKSVLDDKATADGNLAAFTGQMADLDLQIKSYLVPQKGLYRQHCVHCHGTTGDGAGPTASFLNPHPRDYRQGRFKFKSTMKDAKPTVADLRRILIDGIPDTAMPSFALLPPDEVEALVEYVKYLSIRGEAEAALKSRLYDDRKPIGNSRSELVKVALTDVVATWNDAESNIIVAKEPYKPDAERDAWLKAGETLFVGDKAKCFSCHGTTGLGDGRKQSEPLFDSWNKEKDTADKNLVKARDALASAKSGDATAVKQAEDNLRRADNIAHSWKLPLQDQMPRNLRLGRYRFGRRPLDLFYRIYSGINGTEMPAQNTALTEKEIWQLVDYVQALPYFDAHGRLPVTGGAGAGGHGSGHAAEGETAEHGRPGESRGGE